MRGNLIENCRFFNDNKIKPWKYPLLFVVVSYLSVTDLILESNKRRSQIDMAMNSHCNDEGSIY